MLQKVGGKRYNKTRKASGGCGCNLMRGGGDGNNEMRLGPKAKSLKKTLRNREKRREQRIREKRAAKLEAMRRSAIVERNVEGLLANSNNNSGNSSDKLFSDPEYADKIFDKFCEFLEELKELDETAFEEGNSNLSSAVAIQKITIAEKLIDFFGKKKVAATAAPAAAAPNQVVNNFGANLASILSDLKL